MAKQVVFQARLSSHGKKIIEMATRLVKQTPDLACQMASYALSNCYQYRIGRGPYRPLLLNVRLRHSKRSKVSRTKVLAGLKRVAALTHRRKITFTHSVAPRGSKKLD